MDTDDLSKEAYKGIIAEAENFDHDLTLRFGLLSYECANEEEYLDKSIELIKELKELKVGDLDDIFFDKPSNIKSFKKILAKIESNIDTIKKTPLNKRHFDF
jgi:hypothetical protein